MADWKADLWSYPGAGTFTLVWANLPFTEMTVTPRRGRIGDASMTLPASREIIDELLPLMLTRDPADPSRDRRSLVRVYRAGETVPAAEWVPTVIPDSLGEESVTVTGETYGPYRLSDAIVWPFDWPKWLFPDWVWGGKNVLQNPGFEEGAPLPEVQRVWVAGATGGTFTLSDGTDTTLPIAWNATAATLKTRLETDITAIVTVDVEGSGTVTDPWRITWSNPLGPFTQLACDGTALTPGTAFCNVAPEIDGLLAQITGWTPSTYIYGSVHGSHAAGSPRLSVPPEPADTGTYAAFYDADSPFGGIEQRVSVQPGQVYSGARIRVRPNNASDPWRLVLRDRYEGLITGDPPSAVTSTFPTGSYSTHEIPGVHVVGDGVYELTFRHAYVGTGGASGVLVDNANLTLGLQPATVGEMVRLLWEDAAVNHVADGRVVLDNLDLTFTDLVDSDGTPWPREESFTVTHGQSYYQIMESLKEQLGYGWSITPKTSPVGGLTHDFNVYVPGGDGTDRTGDADPAIIVGGGVAAGPVSHAVVAGNAVLAEGAEGLSARAESAASISAAGRREVYVPVGEATSQDTVSALASSQLDELLAQGLGFAVEVPDGAGPVGLVDFDVSDTVNVVHPTLGKVGYRADSHEVRIRPDGARGVTHFSREILHADAAVYEGVRRLLARTASQPPPAPAPAIRQDDKATGGGAPTLVVAAADASKESKARADFVCAGAGDEATINAALSALTAGGRVLLTEGSYSLAPGPGAVAIHVPDSCTLAGLGANTVLFDNTFPGGATLIRLDHRATLRDLYVIAEGDTNTVELQTLRENNVVQDCWLEADQGAAIYAGDRAARFRISRVYIACQVATEPAIWLSGGNHHGWIERCHVQGGSNNLRVDSGAAPTVPSSIRVTNNYLSSAGEDAIFLNCTRGGPSFFHVLGNHVSAAGSFLGASPSRGAITVIGDPDTADGLVDSSDDTQPGTIVADNIIEAASLLSGIYLKNAHGTIIANNHVENMDEHGIRVTDTSDALITDNLILWTSGGDNLSDGILLEGNSDRDHIAHNRIISDTALSGGLPAARFRYGINISAATCNATKYVGNDCSPGANFGTAPYNDAGTGSVSAYPAAAAPQGDNFV